MIGRLNTALRMWTNKFHILTHGDGVPQDKLKEEVHEFLTAQTKEDKLKEASDVTIVLATQLAVYGYTFSDFLEEIERKLDINLMRKWALQEDGTIKHMSEPVELSFIKDDEADVKQGVVANEDTMSIYPSTNESTPEDDAEPTFYTDLQAVLNRHSAESPSGTPDFILANFLRSVLMDYNEAVSLRSEWRGESVELPALQRLADESDRGVVAIVATSQTSGKAYAEELGIKNWLVITDPRASQGLRTRAIIITPGYLEFVLDGLFRRLRILDDLMNHTHDLMNPQG